MSWKQYLEHIDDKLSKEGLLLIKPAAIHGNFFRKNMDKIDIGAGRPRIIGYTNESGVVGWAESLNASQKKLVESLGGQYDSSISAWVLLVKKDEESLPEEQ